MVEAVERLISDLSTGDYTPVTVTVSTTILGGPNAQQNPLAKKMHKCKKDAQMEFCYECNGGFRAEKLPWFSAKA